MHVNRYLWYKMVALILVLVLIVPIMAACDDDDDDEDTTTSADTSPIKIGVLSAWTGPQAGVGQIQSQSISLVEEQVEEMGGILGGRLVKVEKGDTASQVANAISEGKRLILNENIVAIAGPGVSPPEIDAVIDLSDEYKIPCFSWGGEPADLTDHPYVVRMNNLTVKQKAEAGARLAVEVLGAKDVAFLAEDTSEYREEGELLEQLLEEQGSDLGLVQYIPWEATDLSTYLTKIRSDGPDAIVVDFASVAHYMNMWKGMIEQGGWGDVKPICTSAAAGYSVGAGGADGAYFVVNWTLSYPETEGNQKFVSDFYNKYGEYPNTSHMQMYEILWATIKAIEQAGSTDSEAIQKVIRSGNFAYEVAQGPVSISADGEHDLKGSLAQFFSDKGFVHIE